MSGGCQKYIPTLTVCNSHAKNAYGVAVLCATHAQRMNDEGKPTFWGFSMQNCRMWINLVLWPLVKHSL
jgi:hypothetical protein